MARFEFTVPEEETGGALVGVGEGASGQIRAVIAENGKLRTLTISPNLLRHVRGGGTFLDSGALASEITRAVNIAIDDLIRRRALVALPNPVAFNAELSHITSDLSRAVNDVRTELERAERRITGR